MFYDRFDKYCKKKGTSVFAVCQSLGITASTSSSWKKKGNTPSGDICTKLADCLGIPVEYLLKDNPTHNVPDEELKVALFGGDTEVTDEMWEEVRNFARFVEEREAKKRRNE